MMDRNRLRRRLSLTDNRKGIFIRWFGWFCCLLVVSKANGFLTSNAVKEYSTVARRSPFIENDSHLTLRAVSTKSGGRSIQSLQSFETEVLTKGGSEHEIVMVFYTAPWCGPCRLSNPVVKEIGKQFEGKIDLVEVCTDDIPEIPEMTGVESIPTIQIFHQGQIQETIVGCVAKNILATILNKLMDEKA